MLVRLVTGKQVPIKRAGKLSSLAFDLNKLIDLALAATFLAFSLFCLKLSQTVRQSVKSNVQRSERVKYFDYYYDY